MRFDDTNPINEDEEYVQAILEDVRWLGFDWQDRLTHASDYFQKLYDFAEDLIQQGKALWTANLRSAFGNSAGP